MANPPEPTPNPSVPGHAVAQVPVVREALADVTASCTRLSQEFRSLLRRQPPRNADLHIHDLTSIDRTLLHHTTLQICVLLGVHRVRRYTQLKNAMHGISTRTLSARLGALRRAGLVRRVLYDESPPRVDYSLSPNGEAYVDLLLPFLLGQGPPRP
jgi:DNA-binding HxlR family transcriptional regulator